MQATAAWKAVRVERRAILPCFIISCVVLYALTWLSYVSTPTEPDLTSTQPPADSNTAIVHETPLRRRSCNILVAHGGDDGAGFATLIYAYPINFVLYAQKYNFTLWLDYIPSYNDLYYDEQYGNNTFEYYFAPIEPEWNICDRETSTYKVLTRGNINPGIHKRERDSIHLWYYHFKVQNIEFEPDKYLEDWYYDQRLRGSQVVDEYFHLRPDIIAERESIWKAAFGDDSNRKYEVLGVQMRGSDKVQRWSIRRTVAPEEYMPYISAFIREYGNRAKIFFATDDKNYLKFLKDQWNVYVDDYAFHEVVVTQGNVTRSETREAVFDFKGVSKYGIGREVLLDILLLAKCDWFIHSASAVSEAVFFNNIALHNQSIHLEYHMDRQCPFWFR